MGLVHVHTPTNSHAHKYINTYMNVYTNIHKTPNHNIATCFIHTFIYIHLHGIVNEWNMSVNEIEKSNVNVIKEMIDIRDGRSVCENLTREEVLYISDDICLN